MNNNFGTPSPFELGRLIGGNVSGGIQQGRDMNSIDQILAQSAQSQDPMAQNNAISQILQRVSPKNQDKAMDILKDRFAGMQKRQEAQETESAYKKHGLDPSISKLAPALQTQISKSADTQRRYDQITGNNRQQSNNINPDANGQLRETDLNETQPSPYRSLTEDQLIELSGLPDYGIPAKEELKRRQEEVKASKTQFEPESDKLEAKRVSELATEIEKDYMASQSESMRLSRMEALDEKDNLTTPLMITTLNAFGLPVGVLSNPDSEEYAKLEAEYLQDVRNVFPGGRVTNYEVQAYLKGIPSLLNTKEGRRSIIRNRRLINKAKDLRYNAYRDIINENGGRKPPNMGLILNERIQEGMSEIEEEFRGSISNEVEKFQQPIRMLDPNGRVVNIPPSQIEAALNAGAKFS